MNMLIKIWMTFMLYTFNLKTICLCLLLILPFFVPLSGICEDDKGEYKTHGYGTNSCGTFVESRRKTTDYESVFYSTWVTGYLTAVNTRLPVTYSILGTTDIGGAMLWLENYCKENPLKLFSNAVEGLIHELYQKRTIKAP